MGSVGNAAMASQIQGDRAEQSQRLGLLFNAAGQVGQGELDGERVDQLAGIQQRLRAAMDAMGSADIAALSQQLDSLDGDLGRLVVDSGTVLDMKPSGPADAPQGTFDGVDSYYVNGMSSSLTQSMQAARDLADLRGTDVGLVYNREGGIGSDLREAAGQKLSRFIPGWDHQTQEGGTLARSVQGSLDADRQVDIVTHSQGAYFASEAIDRLDNGAAARDRLDQNLHLTLTGAPLRLDELPKGFDNVQFIDEVDDPISGHLGRRTEQDRKWWENIPLLGRDRVEGGDRAHLQFDSPRDGMEAHRPRTYLTDPTSRAALAKNPFERLQQ